MPSPPNPSIFPWRALVLGLAVFAIGLVVAHTTLPEWRQGPLPAEEIVTDRVDEALSELGLKRLGAVEYTIGGGTKRAYERLGAGAVDWLTERQRGLEVIASTSASWPESPVGLAIWSMSADGGLWGFDWAPTEFEAYLPTNQGWDDRAEVEVELARVLAAGDAVSREGEGDSFDGPLKLTELDADGPRQTIFTLASANWIGKGRRVVGALDAVAEHVSQTNVWLEVLRQSPSFFAFLVVVGLLFAFAVRRRLGVANAAILTAAAAAIATPAAIREIPSGFLAITVAVAIVLQLVMLFAAWAASESWMRSTLPNFTTSLDSLRCGQIGPRGGRELAGGWAMGAGIGGVQLTVASLGARLPGVALTETTPPLPVISPTSSPLLDGALIAAFMLLALTISYRSAPKKVRRTAAILGGALLFSFVTPYSPWPAAFVAGIVLAALLSWSFERFGATGLLTASVIALALPSTVLTAKHLSWMPGTFAATAFLALTPLALGFVGVRRPAETESRDSLVPSFVRRLEDERRVKYEMDLFYRMQKGLLPTNPPEVTGYELAADSILATEASGDLYDYHLDDSGQLWLAAGDVSGHGVSCTIEQAMTKAALASLVGPGKRPSEVLRGIDRVLRSARSRRSFTSLCLARLDPETGEITVSSAGHPYPILWDGAEVHEVPCPSLPLGQGPDREYADLSLELRTGGVFMMYSDGIVEALDHAGRMYGFDRPRQRLAAAADGTADEILARFLTDWRRHAGLGKPADDTTVVVLKRRSI